MTQAAPKVKPGHLVEEQQRIKLKLETLGFTLAMIDARYGLIDGCARNTMREPNLRGERAIAAMLNTHPHLLWPSRYRPNGERRRPLDYTSFPTREQRRNAEGART